MKNDILSVVKAVVAAILFSLVFVLLFTVIIQLFNLPMNVVKPVNQVFKILAIAAGGLLFLRGSKGLIKGVIYGVIAVECTYFLFALISGGIAFSVKFLLELLIGAVAGGISGIMAVNIKKNV